MSVHRGPDNHIPYVDIHRHRFAGQHRLIHRGHPVDDPAIHWNLIPGSDQQTHPNLDFPDRDRRAILEGRVLDRQACKSTDGVAGAVSGPPLQPPSEQNKCDDHSRGLEIHVAAIADQCPHRPSPGGSRPQGDQRVHSRGSVSEVSKRHPVEVHPTPPDDRGGKDTDHPLPASEL